MTLPAKKSNNTALILKGTTSSDKCHYTKENCPKPSLSQKVMTKNKKNTGDYQKLRMHVHLSTFGNLHDLNTDDSFRSKMHNPT